MGDVYGRRKGGRKACMSACGREGMHRRDCHSFLKVHSFFLCIVALGNVFGWVWNGRQRCHRLQY
jgi:hypothetical protein